MNEYEDFKRRTAYLAALFSIMILVLEACIILGLVVIKVLGL
jgi:hypothetical protein